MSGNRFIRRGTRPQAEPKIGRMFIISFGLHLLLFLIFSGALVFQGERDRRPVYYVDLTRLPVANPQAGRPDARPKSKPVEQKKPAQKKQTAPVTKAPAPKPTPAKPDAVKKPAVKPQPAPVDIASKIDALKRQQEREELKQKLAALAAGDSRAEDRADTPAPLGMPDGSGDEVGVAQLTWLEAFIKANWSLSRYQVARTDVETEAWVIYNKQGRLVDFALAEPSGDRVFDESIKTAILKSKQLEFEPQFADQKIVITFNLKDLLDR